MYPRSHAVISFAVSLLYAAVVASSVLQAVAWIMLGTFAGVAIDIDHAFIPLFVPSTQKAVLKWMKKPFAVFRSPKEFLDDVEFPHFGRWRLVTHFLFLYAAFRSWQSHPLFGVVFVSMAVHVLCDIGKDVYDETVE